MIAEENIPGNEYLLFVSNAMLGVGGSWAVANAEKRKFRSGIYCLRNLKMYENMKGSIIREYSYYFKRSTYYVGIL